MLIVVSVIFFFIKLYRESHLLHFISKQTRLFYLYLYEKVRFYYVSIRGSQIKTLNTLFRKEYSFSIAGTPINLSLSRKFLLIVSIGSLNTHSFYWVIVHLYIHTVHMLYQTKLFLCCFYCFLVIINFKLNRFFL